MNRTITIKGTGRISLKPDLTVITLTLKSLDKDYDRSMALASEQLDALRSALDAAGFDTQSLKTASFNVCAEHEGMHDKDGNYKNIFVGYACIHTLTLEFIFDTVLLSKALSAISHCVADPELNIQFTVKDQSAVNEALLQSAAENARVRAEILSRASGVTLGELLSIDYNWGRLNVFSRTEYAMEKRCMAMGASANMDIHPADIDVSDNVTFVWEIL